jgi:hypothetical protein
MMKYCQPRAISLCVEIRLILPGDTAIAVAGGVSQINKVTVDLLFSLERRLNHAVTRDAMFEHR